MWVMCEGDTEGHGHKQLIYILNSPYEAVQMDRSTMAGYPRRSTSWRIAGVEGRCGTSGIQSNLAKAIPV